MGLSSCQVGVGSKPGFGIPTGSSLHRFTHVSRWPGAPRFSGKEVLIHMVLSLEFDTILVWILIGLVAGFLASHLALGHGLGIVGDVIAGIVGALLGGFLAGIFHWSIVIVGHPVLSEMVIAFIGAVIVLFVLRLFNMSGARRPSWG